MSLISELLLRLAIGLILIGTLFFGTAGSLKFWQAWIFLGVVFVVLIPGSLYLYKHDPQLIERRLPRKEKIREQRILVRLLKSFLVAAFLLPGLDYRWGWWRRLLGAVPLWLVLLSQAAVACAFLFLLWAMKVNRFAARTIQVEPGQKVISTGPYRILRHPMYSGGLAYLLFTPIALGSYVALPAFALLIPFFVLRLFNEEKLLRQELPGYTEYCLKTRFRLVPFVW